MIVTEIFLSCDFCHEPFADTRYETIGELKRQKFSKEGGWHIHRGKHECPDCHRERLAKAKQ